MDNYKEKYNKALRKALDLYNQGLINPPLEHIFPELKEKESEDEKIKKMCIEYLNRGYQHCSFADDRKNIEKCIAWLEKQGNTLNANDVTKPHWISVEDELPPMRDEDGMSAKVLTHSKGGGIYMNHYDYRHKTWGNPLAFNVTHWMPLPEAPTVAKNATVKKGGEHDTEE